MSTYASTILCVKLLARVKIKSIVSERLRVKLQVKDTSKTVSNVIKVQVKIQVLKSMSYM